AEVAGAAGAGAGSPAAQVIAASTAAEAVSARAERGCRGIQAEGGPASLARLAAEGLLDELCFSVTHRSVGGPSPGVINGAAHDTTWQTSSQVTGEHASIISSLGAG